MKKTLAVILAVFLVLLAGSFALKSVTEKNAQKEHIKLMETLLVGGKNFVKIPYGGEDENIRNVHKAENGFVIETVTYAYADEITMFVGVNLEGKVTGLVAYRAYETDGLGNKILSDHVFLAQFLNKDGTFSIASSNADSWSGATATTDAAETEITVDAISGATVTSKAVVRCVNSAVAYVTGADTESSATSWGG